MKNKFNFIALFSLFLLITTHLKAQITLSSDFTNGANMKTPIFYPLDVYNRVTPSRTFTPPDNVNGKICIVRPLGGIANGSGADRVPDFAKDTYKWNASTRTFETNFTFLKRNVDVVRNAGFDVFHIVLDNPSWDFQRNDDGSLPNNQYIVSTYGNAEPPLNFNSWTEYIKKVMNFLVDTYGRSEIEKIQFGIGREIGTYEHWSGTQSQYFDYYKRTLEAVRSVVPNAKVGAHFLWGSHPNSWGADFVRWCKANSVPYDFVGVSYYPNYQKAGSTNFKEVYQKDFAVIKDIPEWNSNAKFQIHEFALITELGAEGNSYVSAEAKYQNSFMVGLMKQFFENNMQDLFHGKTGTQYSPAREHILDMKNNVYYTNTKTGTQRLASNYVDAIFARSYAANRYSIMAYNYNATPTSNTSEDLNLRLTIPVKGGTSYRYRYGVYNKVDSSFTYSAWDSTTTPGTNISKSTLVFNQNLPVFAFLKYEIEILPTPQFTSNNIVVLRIGDGTTINTGVTRTVSLIEYEKNGTLKTTTVLNSATPLARVTLNDNAATEGILKLSTDNNYLTFVGYDLAPNNLVATAITKTTDKVVLRVGSNAVADYSTKFQFTAAGSNFRSALTTNGTNFYVASANQGISYVPFGASTTDPTIISQPLTPAQGYALGISKEQLYAGYFNNVSYGLSKIGTGLPTSSAISTSLPGLPVNIRVGDFIFFDLNPNVTGDDVLYVTEAAALKKYSLVNGTWIENSSITLDNISFGLTGYLDANKKVQLFFTVGTTAPASGTGENNKLQTITDANAYNAALSGTITDLASAGAGYAFRGVAFTPGSSPLTTLPVSLNDFNGKKVLDGIQLNWNTLSETNNDRFNLQRSDDGKNFQTIASIKGNGTSAHINNYSYLDSKPLPGTNYYLLNQIDYDGKNTVLKTIAVDFGPIKNEVKLYSTSQNLIVEVNTPANGEAELNIYNVNGIQTFSQTFIVKSGTNLSSIDISKLNTGIYVAKIKVNNKVFAKKFIR